ncbi:MAG TPA: NAD(P)H-dependent oxidoreductase [Chitinophagaceae bacterium]|nr:NAD(P)H-dependent oxidoreductase [Chitinophagaceae bacterium]
MKLKVAILLGSVRIGRQSHKIAYYIEEQLQQTGFDTVMIDLAEHPLPMMAENEEENEVAVSDVSFVGNALKESDGIILVTPEYHGSFTGVLKNALDFFWREFARKPMGVITTGSGKMGGINASTQLQHVILSLGAYAVPTKLLVSEIQHAFDEKGKPREDVAKFSKRFLEEFTWLLNAIARYKRL